MLPPTLHLVCGLCLSTAPSTPQRATLRVFPEVVQSARAAPSARWLVPSPALMLRANGSLGASITLRAKRRPILTATPSPTRCAPLIQLDF